jgi:3-hydroxy-9,10-secoandrosta-1,3,5(10)-triene-9,17-dione monooxygenase reductase component
MQSPHFDTREFRNTLGSFATGVTIITTTTEDGEPVGLTANSFNSVSLEPPLILWSLAKTSASVPIFKTTEYWNVHILSVDQEHLSNLFASKGADKFAGLTLDKGLTNAPLLSDCTARLQCRSAFQYDGGDHIILVGEVLKFDNSNKPPLAFLGGQYALTARKPYEGVSLSVQEESLSAYYNENLLGYLVGRTHFQLLEGLSLKTHETPLSDVEFYVLSTLCIRDNVNITELNQYLNQTQCNVQLTELNELRTADLIAIESPGDRICLTHKGRELIVQHIAKAKILEEKIVASLGEGEILALKLLLKKVIKATDKNTPDLWAKHEG